VKSGNLSKSAFFEGVGYFNSKYQTEGGVVHQLLLVSQATVIGLSCSIKISSLHCLILAQSTHVTDRQTRTAPRTDGQTGRITTTMPY